MCALVAGAILASVACGSGPDAGEMVIYSGRSEELVGPIIEQFEEETGISVSVKYGSTGEIAATLLEEGEGTTADVFLAQDPAGLGAVAREGMLTELNGDILGRVPGWARSPDGLWVGISGRARTVVYNTDAVEPAELPSSLADLTGPQWRDRVGWAPTNGSFQAMVTAMRILWGEDAARQWLAAMHSNGARAYPKNTPIVAAAAAGEIDVGLVNHYYLHRFLAEEGEGFSARNHHLTGGGPGSVVLVAGAGILADARNRQSAEAFLRFMLSPVAQRYLTEQTHEYPLIDGVTRSRHAVPLDRINIPQVDMADLTDLAGTQSLLRSLGIIP